jgi:uncharacterized protein YwgA
MGKSAVLLKLFSDFTGRRLDTKQTDDKIILQKIVFILNELGAIVGDYRFSWEKCGPFSQSLHNDISLITDADSSLSGSFSETVQQTIMFVKEILDKAEQNNYSLRLWAEAITSLLFFKKYMYPSYSWGEASREIISLNNIFDDKILNRAIECCEQILIFEKMYDKILTRLKKEVFI